MKKKIPWARPLVGREELKYIKDCLMLNGNILIPEVIMNGEIQYSDKPTQINKP